MIFNKTLNFLITVGMTSFTFSYIVLNARTHTAPPTVKPLKHGSYDELCVLIRVKMFPGYSEYQCMAESRKLERKFLNF